MPIVSFAHEAWMAACLVAVAVGYGVWVRRLFRGTRESIPAGPFVVLAAGIVFVLGASSAYHPTARPTVVRLTTVTALRASRTAVLPYSGRAFGTVNTAPECGADRTLLPLVAPGGRVAVRTFAVTRWVPFWPFEQTTRYQCATPASRS